MPSPVSWVDIPIPLAYQGRTTDLLLDYLVQYTSVKPTRLLEPKDGTVIIQGNLNAAIHVPNKRHSQQTPVYHDNQSNQVPICIPSPGFRQTVSFDSALLAQAPPDYCLARRPVMALVGRGSLQRDNPHHESNSILLGPHGPRSQQAIASAEGVPFEVGEGMETRQEEDRRVRDISIEGRTSEDKLIQTAKYPNSSQRTAFAPYLREGQSHLLFVSIPIFYHYPPNSSR
ncbi:hypothetical protein BKA65DRAFT_473620 [Rhexocercosporidium sp. MPI-PUGE-AT-0058]|nr:hypothetical protein BKA65DRAFT_473620 [Rhexocercosporidium sp. MPI-PUGE-AT-0058]